VDARRRGPRDRGLRPSGQHFLRSDILAAEIVDQARVSGDQYVLDIGAGTGRITRALARRAARVIAVELDPELVRRLRRDFLGDARVDVVEADVLDVRLPERPFRAFGNVPFGVGASILRRLLDAPASSLTRADLILQYEMASKRAATWPGTAAGIGWLPWWQFTLVRRLSLGIRSPAGGGRRPVVGLETILTAAPDRAASCLRSAGEVLLRSRESPREPVTVAVPLRSHMEATGAGARALTVNDRQGPRCARLGRDLSARLTGIDGWRGVLETR
jgi:SAM-dependent methyltransferase